MSDEAYPDALPAGYRLHWYTLEHVLGQGGFGITYLARDTNLDRRVAIKEYLPTEIARRRSDATAHPRTESHAERYGWGLERFLLEARTLARFEHPNIVRVHSVFEANNTAYMVMRFEEGQSLASLLERHSTVPERQLTDCLLQILDGLALVHAAGFIHRDIKPENIYVREDGSPVLLDFGSARQSFGSSKTMTVLVAPGYAPLEQYYGDAATQGAWTDIYGLGATCYRAISGRAPLDAVARAKGVLGSAREALPTAVEVGHGRYSERFLAAVDHAMQLNERDRPQTLAEWRREILAAPAPAPAAAPAVSALSAAATTQPTPALAPAPVLAPSQPPPQSPDASTAAAATPSPAMAPARATGRWRLWAALAAAGAAGGVSAVLVLRAQPPAPRLPPDAPDVSPPSPAASTASTAASTASPAASTASPAASTVTPERPAARPGVPPAPGKTPSSPSGGSAAPKPPKAPPTVPTETPAPAAPAPPQELIPPAPPAPAPVVNPPPPAPEPPPKPPARNETIEAAEAALRGGDQDKAVKLLTPAAAAGDVKAQALLGRALERAGPVHSDLEAYIWYGIATRGGESTAQALRDGVATRLLPQEVAQAQRAVANWKPQPDPTKGTKP